MNVFDTDYSNLFAAGLRVIASRSMGRRSSPESLHCSVVSSSTSTANHDRDLTASSSPSTPWRTFHFPTRLWQCPSPRRERSPSADPNLTATEDDNSKPARRRSMSGGVVEETALDVRIWDWSTRVSNATTVFDEDDECFDPHLDKVDPVDAPTPARTAILVSLPSSAPLWEHQFPNQPLTRSRPSHRDRRVSLQTLPVHMTLPPHSYRSSFDSGETAWESGSSSSSDDESALDDDWHQFRVEWIDFDGTP